LSYSFGNLALAYAARFTRTAARVAYPGAIYAALGESPGRWRLPESARTLAVLAQPTRIIVGPAHPAVLLAKIVLETRRHHSVSSFTGLALYCVYNYKVWSPTDVSATMYFPLLRSPRDWPVYLTWTRTALVLLPIILSA